MGEGTLPPIILELVAKAGEVRSGVREASGELEQFESKAKATLGRAAQVGKAALLGLGAGAVTVGGFALDMADKFEVSRTRLEGALVNSGSDFEEFKGQVSGVDSQMEKFGFTNATTEASLASLTSATHNPTTALGEMGLAANIAKGRNIDLSTATGILIKVQTGHVAMLGRLGIATKDASGKTITQAQALAKLSAMYAGDATRSANTFGGQTAALKAKVEDLGAKLGMVLIPIIQQVISVTMDVIGWFGKHKDIAMVLAGVIGGALVTAIGVYIVTTVDAGIKSTISAAKMVAGWAASAAAGVASAASQVAAWVGVAASATAAFVAENAASLGIIAAIAAIAAGIYELYKHWDQVWGFIKKIAEDAWHFLDSNVVQPIEHGFDLLKTALTGYWTVTVQVWNDIKGVYTSAVSWVSGKVGDVVKFFTGLPGRMAGIFVGMFDGIKAAFRDAIDWIIDGWNALHFRMPSFNTHIPGIGKVGGFDIGLPQIPRLAQGGTITRAGLAMVGDAGPEVLSLPRGAQVTPLSGGASSAGGGSITLNIPLVINGRQFAKATATFTRDELLAMGRGLPSLGLA